MHEMSLALEIGRIAELQAGPSVRNVIAVGVDVGDEAGVEPENLAFCLEAVLATPPFRAKPVIARCRGDVLRVSYLEVDDERSDD
jgi:Zn finger protein HypA/HybF involved in hydrogenase expression